MKNFRTDNIKIDNTTYKLYSIKFNDLYDLYNYLNNKGKSINPIFTNFYSENANSKTHGKSYEAALNDLLSVSYDKEYNDIVRILENTNNSVVVNNNYEVIRKAKVDSIGRGLSDEYSVLNYLIQSGYNVVN